MKAGSLQPQRAEIMNAMNTNVVPISPRQRLANDSNLLDRMLNYDHPALRERMITKHHWTPEFTDVLFVEMKRFLYLCATNDGAMAPPKDIDEIWHNFILFTGDYADFCAEKVGFFLHHQPLTKLQRAKSDGSMATNTLLAARRAFGTLNEHWSFAQIPGSCGPGVCGASTNCQS